MTFNLERARPGIAGLGYVGLPLAVAFGKQFSTAAFDIKPERTAQLLAGRDVKREVDADEFAQAKQFVYSSDPQTLGPRSSIEGQSSHPTI